MSKITWTPWGVPDEQRELAEGIIFVGTPSHGGFWLDEERNALVPASWRKASFNGQGEGGWYEEDCDWCLVALTFPGLFEATERAAARLTFQHWIRGKLHPGVHWDEVIAARLVAAGLEV